MPRELYRNSIKGLLPFQPNGWNLSEIKCERVTPKINGWKNAVYWNIATLGKVRVYVLYDSQKIIHTSFVVRGKEKFLFLGKNDIEIGPCWTHPDYRGNGIYPGVLTRTIQDELAGGVLHT